MIRAELPGVEPEKVDISIEGDRLTVSGEKSSSHESKDEGTYDSERYHGTFRRALPRGLALSGARGEIGRESRGAGCRGV